MTWRFMRLLAISLFTGCGSEHNDANDAFGETPPAGSDKSQTCGEQTVTVDGEGQPWRVCTISNFDVPSSGIYIMCVVNQDGVLGVTGLRGDLSVVNPGWRHSAYGNGLAGPYLSTLSETEEHNCESQIAEFRQEHFPAPR